MARKRSEMQRELDLMIEARMSLEGSTLREIAAAVHVSFQQVADDLIEVRRRWQESASLDTAEHVASELARLVHVEEEAWAGWRRSLRATERIADGRDGRVEFLQTILNCSTERRKLLGLDAPQKIDLGERLRAMGLADDEMAEVLAEVEAVLRGERV